MLCLSEVIGFTRDCEAAIKRGRQGFSDLKRELSNRLAEFTSYETDVPLLELKVWKRAVTKNPAPLAMKYHARPTRAGARAPHFAPRPNPPPPPAPQVKALVLDLIHNIDVVDQLAAANTGRADDWQWRKQLRYYLSDKGTVVMRMVAAQFDYTYEYQGNAPKLVHTPLTDKCYLTLTQVPPRNHRRRA